MNRRTLYLPIETKSREMPGKTLLAARAVDRGWRVFLGGIEMHHHMAEILTPGLLIENNIPDSKSTQLHHLKNRGYRIADLCEESIIYPDAEDYCGRKVGPRSLEATDLLLATGARCEQDIREHRPAAARKLIVTGNPRFDTLMPHLRSVYEDDAREIRQRYGRFLLVNTNFSSTNPFKAGLDVVAVLQRDGKLTRPAMAALKRRQVAFKARQMKGLYSRCWLKWRRQMSSIESSSARIRRRTTTRGAPGRPTRTSKSSTRAALVPGCWPRTWCCILAARLASRRSC